MDKIADIKIVGANKIFSDLLDKEFSNVTLESAAGAFVFKIKEHQEIFMNVGPRVTLSKDGILLEGYCVVGDSLGNLCILISKLS
jgi:hypothetical protein